MLGDIASKGRTLVRSTYRRMVDGEPEETQNVPPHERIDVRFVACIPDGDELIVRTRCVAYASEEGVDLAFSATDTNDAEIAASHVVLSRTFFDGRDTGEAPWWEIIASTRVPRTAVPLRLHVADASGRLATGVRCLNKRRFHRLMREWGALSTSAWDDPSYSAWFAAHRATADELARQTDTPFAYEPLISIVVPLFNTPAAFFRAMATSVLAQSYRHWELVLVNASPDNAELAAEIAALADGRVKVVALAENKGIVANTNAGIEAATGDFIAFLDHDDFIEPDTLHCYVAAMNEHEECDILYCDEDSCTPGGRFVHPHFKSDFNRDLLYSHNYITHFLMIRASVVRRVGLSPSYVEGAQDYDLTLRSIEVAREVVHIPRVLYHWRIHRESTSANAESKPYAQEAGRRALQDHFARRGIAVDVEDGAAPFTYVERYCLEGSPLVSIIIPTKDHLDVLRPCVESILTKATYANYEIVLVENNSSDKATFAYYEELARDGRVRVETFEGAFNYSAIVNFGARRAKGEYLLFLNNDTEVITPDFIERMLGFFAREEVGVVGARLLHRDGTVQHAGVFIGPQEAPWHVFMDAPRTYNGYVNRAIITQDYLAVTGACQLVSRSLFDELGGYDEAYAVGYNDVDFCLRAREAGRLCVYAAPVELFHCEFASRGFDVSREDRIRFFAEKARLHCAWPRYFVEGDPYYNPNLDKESLFFGLGD